VKPFRVAESPSQLECKVLEVKEMGVGGGAGNLVICQVVRIHIKEEVLNEEQKIDQRKMKLVGRLGGSWYSKTNEAALFELAQPMSPTLGYDGLPEYVRLSDKLSGNDIGKLASVASMPDTATKEAVIKERLIGSEWDQIKSYLSQGNHDKALALLELLHQ
jgi:hypothetical protein